MSRLSHSLVGVSAAAALLVALTSCAPAAQSRDAGSEPGASGPDQCRTLDPKLDWPDDAREALDAMLVEVGDCSNETPEDAPVAIFDWDNTVVKNDVGYGTNYWMLNHDRVLQPADADWTTTSRYLTDAAADALATACGDGTPPGEPLPTSTDADCADEIVAVLDGETRGGETAFEGYDARRINAAYAWSAALLSGYTADEARGIAEDAKADLLAEPEGAVWTVGTSEVDGYVHVYPQIADLVGAMQENGIAPWVVSASGQPVVDAWAEEAGFDPERVIGVRNLEDAEGRIVPGLQGCGDVADGEDAVMTYIDGKRCWANQEIFGITGAQAFDPAPKDRRQVFGAGDSDTDVTFLQDATVARLVIDRHKTELMCRALDDEDGRWIVVPMFVDPKDPQEEPYPCSTDGRIEPDGSTSPLLREDGSTVEDQREQPAE